MKTVSTLMILGALALCPNLVQAGDEKPAGDSTNAKPIVELHTNVGKLTIELWPSKAPKTVENFLEYVNSGFYNGTIFHRVVPGFVIQAGGFTQELKKKPGLRAPFQLEASARNDIYTLSMARTNNPNSATSQFFVNLKNNTNLNPGGAGPGYAVFGKVIDGTGIVDHIGRMKTNNRGGAFASLPANEVVIEKAVVVAAQKQATANAETGS